MRIGGWSSRSAAARRGAGLRPGTGAAQRRQPAPHRLLPVAAARPPHRPAPRERRDAVSTRTAPASTRCWRRRGRRRRSRALFYFLNRTGYNGLCRFNRRATSTCRSARTSSIRYTRDFAASRRAGAVGLHARRHRVDPARRRRLHLRRPALRRGRSRTTRGRLPWDDQVRAATRLAAHRGPACSSTRRRRGSSTSTARSGTRCGIGTCPAASVHRRSHAREGSWRRGICTPSEAQAWAPSPAARGPERGLPAGSGAATSFSTAAWIADMSTTSVGAREDVADVLRAPQAGVCASDPRRLERRPRPGVRRRVLRLLVARELDGAADLGGVVASERGDRANVADRLPQLGAALGGTPRGRRTPIAASVSSSLATSSGVRYRADGSPSTNAFTDMTRSGSPSSSGAPQRERWRDEVAHADEAGWLDDASGYDMKSK